MPKNRNAALENGLGRHGCPVRKNRSRPTGQDHALGRIAVQEGIRHILKRVNFAIDIQLAQPPRNQLGYLRPEVDNENHVRHACLSLCVARRHNACLMKRQRNKHPLI